MVPRVTAALHSAVGAAIRGDGRQRGGEYPSIAPSADREIARFQTLTQRLEREGLPHLATTFRDPDGTPLPVLLAPATGDLRRARATLVERLERSSLSVYPVDRAAAENIMIDRLSEDLAVRQQSYGRGESTVVHSNRSGDTIVHCKGFFVSTASGFGCSTPATGRIAPGRYTFALSLPKGRLRFDGLIWTCPHPNVRLNLP